MPSAVNDEIVEFCEEKGGVYFRSILVPKAGTMIPQHVHPHDHATYCGRGRAAPFVQGVRQPDLLEGHAFEVKAGIEHAFVTLEDNTRLACCHDAASALAAKEK